MFYFKCPGLKGSVRLGKKSLGSPALLSASTPPLWQDTKGRLHGTKCLPFPSWTHIQAPSVQFHLRRISLTVGVKTPRTTQMVQSSWAQVWEFYVRGKGKMKVTASLCSSSSQSGVPEPETWMSQASPRNLLETHIHESHPDSWIRRSAGGPQHLCFKALEACNCLRSIALRCGMTEQVTELRSAELNSNFTCMYSQVVWTRRNYFTSLSLSSISWLTKSGHGYGN